MDRYYFKGVTLLITVYNRSRSLERLLISFQSLNCFFEEVVVADDCSQPEHLRKIRALQNKYSFRLITSPVNRGLGNNLNKGQESVTTPYTLYIQEDFVPRDIFPQKLTEALQCMENAPAVDLVRFYAYFRYPCLKPVNSGLSEMVFTPTYLGYQKFYMYSDHPHLRRSNFLQKFGRYTEGVRMDKTEYLMMMSFLHNKGRALYFDDYQGIFDQLNPPEEPSTVKRKAWRTSDNFLVAAVRHVYRHIKFRYDFLFNRN
jgi:glycosyltransferase involved in cell wall biosynthesis